MSISQEELNRRIEEARQRMREKPRIWSPKAGDEKTVLFVKVQQIDTEIGKSDFLILEDVTDGQRFSVPKHAVLENHMEPGGIYLLRYNGTRQGKARGRSPYHDWSVEEVLPPPQDEGPKDKPAHKAK